MIIHILICLVLISILHQYTYFPYRSIFPCLSKKSPFQQNTTDQKSNIQMNGVPTNQIEIISLNQSEINQNKQVIQNDSTTAIEMNALPKNHDDVMNENVAVEKIINKLESQVLNVFSCFMFLFYLIYLDSFHLLLYRIFNLYMYKTTWSFFEF